ncbi:MAG: condensation domain-containing protein, partial [Lachnospiraceae bacterium]|nr:condensation domain-containing protein [Lachnospiraceae bacterium]
KYIIHPHYGRLFKTGDGAKVLENGVIKITGRKDGVMKLHGQRLDPGEIEQVMELYPGVRKGAVHIQGEGAAAVLCGFYTSRDKVDPSELRKWLSKRLPYYMIPVLFKELEELPLNTNGKLDRKSLPYIEETMERALYEAPSSKEEAVLCDLFMEVLGEGLRVGAGDSFFALGGDSILGMRIVSEARNRGWKLELPALFASPVVRDLALTLKPIEKTSDTADMDTGVIKDRLSSPEKAAVISKVSFENVQAVYPLLPAMRNHFLYREGMEWDAAEMLNIKIPVDIQKLRERFNYLTTKRAALRTSLVIPEDGRPLLVVRADAENTLEYLDLEYLQDTECTAEDAETQIERYGSKVSDRQREYIRSYVDEFRMRSITGGKPGALTGIIKLGPENLIIFVIFSHYVLDGTGAHRIAEELLKDMPVRDDLEDIARYYQRLASDRHTEDCMKYWSAMTEGLGYTKLPVKADAPSQESQSMRMRRFPMDRILAYGRANRVTTAAVIHTAVGMALSKVTGSDRVCFSTIGNGREEQLTEDERLTGAFSSEMPVVYKKGDSVEDIQRQLLSGRGYNVFDFELLGKHFSGEEAIAGSVRCDILNFPEAEGTGPAAYNLITDQFLYIPEDSLKDILLYFVLRDDLMMTCEFYPRYADPSAVSKFCRYFAEAVKVIVGE